MREGPDLIPALMLAAAYPEDFNLRIAAYKLEDAWAERCENPDATPPVDFGALAAFHPGAACWLGMEVEFLLQLNDPPGEHRGASFRAWLERHLKLVPAPEWAKPGGG